MYFFLLRIRRDLYRLGAAFVLSFVHATHEEKKWVSALEA